MPGILGCSCRSVRWQCDLSLPGIPDNCTFYCCTKTRADTSWRGRYIWTGVTYFTSIFHMPASQRNVEIRHCIVGKGWRILCTLREYQLKCLMSLDTESDRGGDICHQWHQGQWGLAWRVTLEIIQLVPPAHSFGDKSEDWARCEAARTDPHSLHCQHPRAVSNKVRIHTQYTQYFDSQHKIDILQHYAWPV